MYCISFLKHYPSLPNDVIDKVVSPQKGKPIIVFVAMEESKSMSNVENRSHEAPRRSVCLHKTTAHGRGQENISHIQQTQQMLRKNVPQNKADTLVKGARSCVFQEQCWVIGRSYHENEPHFCFLPSCIQASTSPFHEQHSIVNNARLSQGSSTTLIGDVSSCWKDTRSIIRNTVRPFRINEVSCFLRESSFAFLHPTCASRRNTRGFLTGGRRVHVFARVSNCKLVQMLFDARVRSQRFVSRDNTCCVLNVSRAPRVRVEEYSSKCASFPSCIDAYSWIFNWTPGIEICSTASSPRL